jgi:hypothetical protein
MGEVLYVQCSQRMDPLSIIRTAKTVWYFIRVNEEGSFYVCPSFCVVVLQGSLLLFANIGALITHDTESFGLQEEAAT